MNHSGSSPDDAWTPEAVAAVLADLAQLVAGFTCAVPDPGRRPRPNELAVVHGPCGEHVTTIGPGDDMSDIFGEFDGHLEGCPATPAAALESADLDALAAAGADAAGLAAVTGAPPPPPDPGFAVILGPPPRGLAASGGVPPAGMDLTSRRRWAASWTLHVQAKLTNLPNVHFHGTPGTAGGDPAVTIGLLPAGKTVLGQLTNVRNPGKPFGWGYTGAGPTALAKSLLTAALGRNAACPGCHGTGMVTWLTADAPNPVPWVPAHDDLDPAYGGAVDDCRVCDADGLRVPPGVTARLVTELVAGRWRRDTGWWISRTDLLNWLERQDTDPALAITAAGVYR